jgi:hypothetical protein
MQHALHRARSGGRAAPLGSSDHGAVVLPALEQHKDYITTSHWPRGFRSPKFEMVCPRHRSPIRPYEPAAFHARVERCPTPSAGPVRQLRAQHRVQNGERMLGTRWQENLAKERGRRVGRRRDWVRTLIHSPAYLLLHRVAPGQASSTLPVEAGPQSLARFRVACGQRSAEKERSMGATPLGWAVVTFPNLGQTDPSRIPACS